MKNKLKLGQAAGVVAFAIIIGAVSMSSSSTVMPGQQRQRQIKTDQ